MAEYTIDEGACSIKADAILTEAAKEAYYFGEIVHKLGYLAEINILELED